MNSLIYGTVLFILVSIVSSEEEGKLPPVSQELVDKLETWEADKRKVLESEIQTKRTEVITVLRKHMSEVTSSGNLDGALAVKKEIAEQEKKIVEPSPQTASIPNEPFEKWVRSIEMHESDGWWEIEGDEMVQHFNGAAEKRFPCKVDKGKGEASFVASGRTYFLQFVPDRSKGIRFRADDWPARVFTTKSKR